MTTSQRLWSLPPGQTQLLRLLLDVFVVQGGALLGGQLTSTDLDADLL